MRLVGHTLFSLLLMQIMSSGYQNSNLRDSNYLLQFVGKAFGRNLFVPSKSVFFHLIDRVLSKFGLVTFEHVTSHIMDGIYLSRPRIGSTAHK
jgi:hypothetical protein